MAIIFYLVKITTEYGRSLFKKKKSFAVYQFHKIGTCCTEDLLYKNLEPENWLSVLSDSNNRAATCIKLIFLIEAPTLNTKNVVLRKQSVLQCYCHPG
jgi:hypothetical protein